MVLGAQTYVQAPYHEVWRHLTEAEGFGAWHSAPGQRFGGAVGEPVAWGPPGADPVYFGVLQRLEPGRGLAHTFSFSFVSPAETSVVSWDVVAQGPVVWVRVRHDCTDAPRTAEIISDVGWAKSLARLKTWLETGEEMPWPTEGSG